MYLDDAYLLQTEERLEPPRVFIYIYLQLT